MRALKALQLVVIKAPGGDIPDTVELHPLIREFIRRHFLKEERTPYIDSIIRFYERMIERFRKSIENVPFSVLENWTSKVELCIHAERYSDALEVLVEVMDSLIGHGYSEEFVRLAMDLTAKYKPNTVDDTLVHFDQIYEALSYFLTALGQFDDAERALSEFESTLIGKDARYILFCKMKASSLWLKKDYHNAMDWAQRGSTLKTSVRLDTKHDCTHILALAQRDAGEVDNALKYFLEGVKLEFVLSLDSNELEKDGSFYGNIGRCLQYQNRNADALTCFKKSAKALETARSSISLLNQGWAACWIGEVLKNQNLLLDAYVAFRRAAIKWKPVSPPRFREAMLQADEIQRQFAQDGKLELTDEECERMFVKWLQTS